jgi:hypothetical protein
MFDLNKAIRQWCEIALSADSIKSRNIDELIDHLHCEVESIINESKGKGVDSMSEQEAFGLAIQKVGEANVIADEYGKNRTFLQKLCALEYGRIGDQPSDESLRKQLAQMKTSNAILWAAAILSSAIILKDSPQLYQMLFIVLLPLATMSVILTASNARNELSCLVSKFKKMLNHKE